jgi:CO/xanthine dehydrogenase FAD-binding subunit
VKPAPFDHVVADTVEAAVAFLDGDPGARILAGGQSLLPLMALRRLRPTLLVDITRLDLTRIHLDPTASPRAPAGTPPGPPPAAPGTAWDRTGRATTASPHHPTGDAAATPPGTPAAHRGTRWDTLGGATPSGTSAADPAGVPAAHPHGSHAPIPAGGAGVAVGRGGGGGVVRLGALVRHRRLERDAVVRRTVPLLAEAARLIGHPAIRHRGTLGGSLAYADPAAELPAALVALGGEVAVHGPGGVRTVAAADLFAGPFLTTLGPAELVVEVRVPSAGPRHGAAFCEWAPRHNDRAVAGVALTVERDAAGACASVRAAACAVAGVPLELSSALATALGESAPSDALLRTIAESVRTAVLTSPPAAGGEGWSGPETEPGQVASRADREDRAELAGLLAARALRLAFDRSATPAVAA